MPTLGSNPDFSLPLRSKTTRRQELLNMLETNVLTQLPKPTDNLGTVLAKTQRVVFSIIRLFPTPKQRAELIEILRSVQDLTRPIPGCLGCWLADNDFVHDHVRYTEQWESDQALHDHIRSDLYGRVLAAMELSKRPPEVRFYFSSEQKGFELIESLRHKGKVAVTGESEAA
jgi:quinol monooxygenase YgiN